jgi:hypothetical protein
MICDELLKITLYNNIEGLLGAVRHILQWEQGKNAENYREQGDM